MVKKSKVCQVSSTKQTLRADICLTSITHVIVEGGVCEMTSAAGIVAWLGISAVLVLGCGIGVCTQISRLKRGLSLQAGVVTGLHLRNSPEDMVQSEAVANLMDHGVSVAKRTIKRRV